MDLGLGLNLGQNGGPKRFTGDDFNFAVGRYAVNGPYGSSVPAALTYSRTGSAYARTVAGALTAFAANTPRITNKGMLIEAARTNLVLNADLSGVSGGAPTSWGVLHGSGGTTAASTYGAPGAMTFTASASRNTIFQNIAVAANTTYVLSCLVESNPDGMAGSQMLTGIGPASSTTGTASPSTPVAGDVISLTVTTAGTSGTLILRFGAGVSSNTTGTVRLSAVQVEAAATASSFISTGSSTTRGADTASIAVPSNCNSYIVDHDGGQATGSATPGGSFNLGSSSAGAWVGQYVQRVRLIP